MRTHKSLDIDFRALQTQLLKRDFIRSSEILGPTDGIFKTREHGYRRIDDATFLHVMDFEVGHPYSLKMARPDFVCIQITISGSYNRWVSDKIDAVKPATLHITNVPLSISDTQTGTKLRGALIVCDREYLVNHFKLNVDRLPAAYRPIFNSKVGSLSALKLTPTPDVMIAADQILSCKYNEPLKHLYLNAKATEIICAIVAQINGLSPRTLLHRPEVADKKQAIEAAATIYKREIVNPPTIEQLAARIGLNRNDIISGFREVFGVTPHTYGHLIRMEQAQLLLQDGQLSISEIARRIGYEGYSSFTRAYRAHFGTSPSVAKPPLKD